MWSMSIDIAPEERKFTERPTVVTVHGWRKYLNFRRGTLKANKFQMVPNTFKKLYNVNVVTIRWKNGFFYGYNAASEATEGIGRNVAAYLNRKLLENLVLWRNLTIVGHSLGGNLLESLIKLFDFKKFHIFQLI